MRNALERISKIITRSQLAPQLSFVRVQDGMMHATDGRMYVAAPVSNAPITPFVVPGAQLQKALSLPELNVAHDVDKQTLVCKHRRSRITIGTVEPDTFPIVEPPALTDWQDFTDGLLEAMKLARRFVSDNATQSWAMGVSVVPGGIVATNNIVLAFVDYPSPPMSGNIPFWLIDFLAGAEEKPVSCAETTTALYFKWPDGAWLRSARLEGQMPTAALAMAARLLHEDEAKWRITEEWREAYKLSLKFATNEVYVAPDAIVARDAVSEIRTEIESPVDQTSVWDPRYLGAVLEVATHWDLGAYPKPTFFSGHGIKGMVVGRAMAGA